jgi:hypothetical protein
MSPHQLGESRLVSPRQKRFQELPIRRGALVLDGRHPAKALEEYTELCAAHGYGSRRWSRGLYKESRFSR